MVTGSGDRTVKVWDLLTSNCLKEFNAHGGIVWTTKFHDTGKFVISGGDDNLIKLWDLNKLGLRQTFVGHTDSVNKVNFQPFTNYFASCSSDKSISIWDMRERKTQQTFFGHLNSINDLVFNSKGDLLASCDADGIVKVWDIRTISELATFHSPVNKPANTLEIDKSGNVLFVGYENGNIGVVNLQKKESNTIAPIFKGHDGGVTQLGINLLNANLYSVGSDGKLNIWQ